ncbi:MAG: GNAT family N-acetyltransferase [Candidatus Heimdallarchaeota archaeon]|nr:GNAT family N-acetyltransferase [Candidatus Heimdallarchaeota archaeon]
MEPSYTVRQADLNDINEIMKINKICLPENYSFDFFYRILSEFGYVCVVAENEGVIVGYVLSRIERPFTSFLGVQNSKGHIISIAIIPKHRRKGLGLKTMKYGLKKLIDHDVETIYLEVRVSNVAAVEMYKKLGFYIKKEYKEYYRDGESALVMEWGKKESSEMT